MHKSEYTVEYLSEYNTKYIFIHIPLINSNGSHKIPFVYAPNGLSRGTKSAVDLVKETNFTICINAGLFNPAFDTYEPEGLIIENGAIIQNKPAVRYPDSKPLTIDSNGLLSYVEPTVDANELVANGITSAVCGFMPIVVDGNPVARTEWTCVPHYNGLHQRQVIGQFENGDYAIITCEGRGYNESEGWTIAQTQEICIKHGLKFAYN